MKKWIQKSVWYLLIVLTVCTGIAVKNVSLADGLATTDDGLYKIYIFSSENYASIVEYLGTDEKVTIPAQVAVSNIQYPVERLSCNKFGTNVNVKEIAIPNTIHTLNAAPFDGETLLEKLNTYIVNPNYEFLQSRNGILYGRMIDKKLEVVKYPEGRTETTYILPADVSELKGSSFTGNLKLRKIVLHENITRVGEYAISPTSDIQLYINCSTLYQFSNKSICHLHSGSTIYVKTDVLKTQLETTKKDILYDCDGVNIVSLQSNSSATVPCTSLTFEDGSTVKNITLSPGQTYKINYNKAPADTTDTITWNNSGSGAAFYKTNNGDYPIGTVRGVSCGDSVITGTTESGKTITLNVKVYSPVESVSAGGDSETTFVCSAENDYNGDGLWECDAFWIEAAPSTAYNAMRYDKRTWASSDAGIACFPDSKDRNMLLTGKPGTVNITASLDDEGRIFTVPFTLHVKKSTDLLTVDAIPPQQAARWADVYTCSYPLPKPVVRDENKVLTEGVDYTLSYSYSNAWADDGLDAHGEVTVAGTGDYSGTQTVVYGVKVLQSDSAGMVPSNFTYDPATGLFVDTTTGTYYTMDPATGTLVPYNPNSGITQPPAGGTGNETIAQGITGVKDRYDKYYGDKAFTLKASCPGNTGKITYSSNNKKVVTVGSTNGKVTIKGTGAAVITIRCGSLSKKVTITVAPKKMAKPKVKAGKKQFKVSWKKDSRADGYEIQYSTDKKLKKGCYTQAVKKNKTTSQTIKKKLKSKKTYYVRIRAYKSGKVNGKNTKLYSKWSSTVKVKVK